MSLFLDEKTKEEKARGYTEATLKNRPSIGWVAQDVRDSYLAGWNECENHIKSNTAKGFGDWWFRNAPPKKKNDEFFRAMASTNPEHHKASIVWQACSIMKDKELEEATKTFLDSNAQSQRVITEKDKRIKELEAYIEHQLPTNKTTIFRIKEPINQFFAKDFKDSQEKIQSLESQLKERDEALIDFVKVGEHDRPDEISYSELICDAIQKHQSLINQIKESRK